ncbi:MAG TPA: MarR family transcriptional regulator [Acidimicrobiales bacterium]|nr:MarR family transcriptional regulator [Acidimicrobiales bacterium]
MQSLQDGVSPEAHDPDLDTIIETVLTTSRVFVAIAARSLASIETEVTLPQFRLLIVLAAHGPQTLRSLADFLAVNASTAMRMCDRLIRKGLIRRRTSPSNRREVRLALTEKGRVLVDHATKQRRIELSRLLESVPKDEQRHLIRALTYINVAAGEVPDQDWASGWQ